jgi:hypothetical protein
MGTVNEVTAYLGGASPVLHLRDSRLWWGVGTERGWVNAGGGGYVQRLLAGCRYRVCPTPGQAAMLARTFGWAPVVFNDVLRARQDAHTSGEKGRRRAGAAQGRHARQDHRGPAVAGRGRAGGARAGLPGRVAGVAELVRLPGGCRQGPQGRAPPVPVPQGGPGLDPADPRRLGCRRRRCASREGRRRSAGVLARSARCGWPSCPAARSSTTPGICAAGRWPGGRGHRRPRRRVEAGYQGGRSACCPAS